MKYYLYYYLLAWIGLAESIVAILTFGFYFPPWHIKMITWITDQRIKDSDKLTGGDQ